MVNLGDASLFPEGRSKPNGIGKCARLRKKCRSMVTLQMDQSNTVLEHNEDRTVGEET